MFTAEQKTKASEILDRINALSMDDRRNTFLLNRIKREAQELTRNANATEEDFVALGAIAATLRDHAGVKSAFTNALGRAPSSFLALVNYSMALEDIGRVEESVNFAHQAHKIRPGDLEGIDRLLNAYVHFGKFHSANEMILQWDREKPGCPHKRKEFVQESTALLNENCISEEVTSQFVKTALDFVVERGFTFDSMSFDLLHDEYSGWISCIVMIREARDEVFEANLALFEELARTTLVSDSNGVISVRLKSV